MALMIMIKTVLTQTLLVSVPINLIVHIGLKVGF